MHLSYRVAWREKTSTLHTLAVSAIVLLLGGLCGCGGGSGQKVLYVVGPGSLSVAIFQVSSSGALVATDSVGTGAAPDAIGIDPLLRFAYVVDSASGIGQGGVSQYTVNKATGVLAVATLPAANGTTPPSTPVPTGVNPKAITIDGTGAFAFVANQGSNAPNPTNPASQPGISVFTIDPTGGALTEVKQLPPPPDGPSDCTRSQITTTCPLPTMTGAPSALATTRKMLFVATVSNGSGSLATYTFDSTGSLTPKPPTIPPTTAVGVNPSAVAMDPSGKFLFVTDHDMNSVTVFSIGSSGPLTAVGSPAAAGTSPVGVRVHPSGKFLYTANQGSNDVSAFSVDSSGALKALSGSPFAAGASPSSVTIDGSGRFLFVADRDSNNVSVFSIDSSGTPKPVTGSPFGVIPNPSDLASIN